MTKLRRIAAHYIYTPQGLLKERVIVLDKSGRIVAIEREKEIDRNHSTEFYSGIVIPGMVNAHTHLELSHLKGEIESGGGFTEFVKSIGRVREKWTKEERERAAEYYDAKMWSEGVEAVGDISNSEQTFELKKKSKIKYHSFIEVFGLSTKSIEREKQIAQRAKEMGLNATITPHSVYSLNEKLLEEAVGESENSPLSVHFLESRDEIELYDREGEMWKWYTESGMNIDFIGKYKSPTERVIERVPTEREMMLVHSVWVSESEVERLKQRYGDRVTFVVCPKSNSYIGVGEAPIEMLLKAGVRVAIGTDSMASNQEISMVEEMKQLKNVKLEEILHAATLAGAEAVGMESEIGSLEVGKRPGVVVLTGVDYQKMELTENAKTERIV